MQVDVDERAQIGVQAAAQLEGLLRRSLLRAWADPVLAVDLRRALELVDAVIDLADPMASDVDIALRVGLVPPDLLPAS